MIEFVRICIGRRINIYALVFQRAFVSKALQLRVRAYSKTSELAYKFACPLDLIVSVIATVFPNLE